MQVQERFAANSYQFRLILKELTALKGVGTNTDFVLAADTSTFLPLTTAPDGLAALLDPNRAPDGQDR